MSYALRRKYVPDLSGMHCECEVNYSRLQKILPCFQTGSTFQVQLGEEARVDEAWIRFSILSSSRYTSEVDIQQLSQISDWCDPPNMRIRVYHDTRMAEVICYQGVSRLRPVYNYPNDRMRQPDEKSAVNKLLSDWLRLCLEMGCATAGVSVSSES